MTLYGPTEIVAVVKQVDADEPHVILETLQGGVLHCETTAEIAGQLGIFLYQQVKVRGLAHWDFATLALVGFEIAAVLPYERSAPTAAFAALRVRFGDCFDRMDDD